MRWSRLQGAVIAATALLFLGASASDAHASGPVAVAADGQPRPMLVVATIRPARPTNFRVSVSSTHVSCPPSFDATGPVCVTIAFGWSETDAGPSFRIYHGFTGEGPDQACADQLGHATFVIGASVGGRHRIWYRETDLTGGGTECYWIEAVNAAGHSQLVPLTGQAGLPVAVVTMTDRGGTIHLAAGQQLLVELGSFYDWSFTVSDTHVLAAGPDAALPAGAQARFVGAAPGTAVVRASGDPLCRKVTPPCGAPSILFSFTVVVG